jgi:uncharacterized protein (TIGR02246 family)
MLHATVILAICLAATTNLAAGQNAGGKPDEAAIREVVKKYVEARELRDPAAIAALFTPDADQLTSSGDWRRGRDALVKGALASSQNNAGKRSITLDAIRFPATGVALADGAYTIAGEQGTAARNMRTSFLLLKSGGEWRISAIRNMLPAKQ